MPMGEELPNIDRPGNYCFFVTEKAEVHESLLGSEDVHCKRTVKERKPLLFGDSLRNLKQTINPNSHKRGD